jgi:hypothetical protein
MYLTYGQQRALRKLKRAIRVSDPRLARLDMFGRLNRDQACPESSSRSSRRRPETISHGRLSLSAGGATGFEPSYGDPDASGDGDRLPEVAVSA